MIEFNSIPYYLPKTVDLNIPVHDDKNQKYKFMTTTPVQEAPSAKKQRTCFGTYTEQSFGHDYSLGFFDDISKKE